MKRKWVSRRRGIKKGERGEHVTYLETYFVLSRPLLFSPHSLPERK